MVIISYDINKDYIQIYILLTKLCRKGNRLFEFPANYIRLITKKESTLYDDSVQVWLKVSHDPNKIIGVCVCWRARVY